MPTYTTTPGSDVITGSVDDDLFIASDGGDRLDGADGIDTLDFSGVSDRIIFCFPSNVDVLEIYRYFEEGSGGGTTPDTYHVTEATNFETFILTGFNDAFTANSNTGRYFHDMTVFAGDGDDFLSGSSGDDSLYGENGDDWLHGNDGNDFLNGGLGNDDLNGEDGNDILLGDQGNDVLSAELGDDTLYGHAGNDSVAGGAGQDFLHGGGGNDLMYGNAGDDIIYGASGADYVRGGAGNDNLYGGNFGGPDGAQDTFAFANTFNRDVIRDFEDGTDLIDFTGHTNFNDFDDVMQYATDDGSTLYIRLNAQNFLIIENFTLAEMDASDFVF